MQLLHLAAKIRDVAVVADHVVGHRQSGLTAKYNIHSLQLRDTYTPTSSSVIAAPYRGSQGDVVGVVGVIGPTRLNYARVIPMVDFTAKALTRLMA